MAAKNILSANPGTMDSTPKNNNMDHDHNMDNNYTTNNNLDYYNIMDYSVVAPETPLKTKYTNIEF